MTTTGAGKPHSLMDEMDDGWTRACHGSSGRSPKLMPPPCVRGPEVGGVAYLVPT
jgi:hypothetical protein